MIDAAWDSVLVWQVGSLSQRWNSFNPPNNSLSYADGGQPGKQVCLTSEQAQLGACRDMDTAIAAFRSGAHDVLKKPIHLQELLDYVLCKINNRTPKI